MRLIVALLLLNNIAFANGANRYCYQKLKNTATSRTFLNRYCSGLITYNYVDCLYTWSLNAEKLSWAAQYCTNEVSQGHLLCLSVMAKRGYRPLQTSGETCPIKASLEYATCLASELDRAETLSNAFAFCRD